MYPVNETTILIDYKPTLDGCLEELSRDLRKNEQLRRELRAPYSFSDLGWIWISYIEYIYIIEFKL